MIRSWSLRQVRLLTSQQKSLTCSPVFISMGCWGSSGSMPKLTGTGASLAQERSQRFASKQETSTGAPREHTTAIVQNVASRTKVAWFGYTDHRHCNYCRPMPDKLRAYHTRQARVVRRADQLHLLGFSSSAVPIRSIESG